MSPILLAQEEAALFAIFLIVGLIYFAFLIFVLASFWKIFTKAGEDGWKALVPFLNGWLYAEIVGRPGWWGLLLYVPPVSIVFSILLAIDLAKSFGKDPAFAVGLVLLAPVFHGILAYGSAQYLGPAGPEGRPGWQSLQGGYGQGGYGLAQPAPQGGYQPPAGQQWGQSPQPQPLAPPQQAPQQPDWGSQPGHPSGGEGGWGDQSGQGRPNP